MIKNLKPTLAEAGKIKIGGLGVEKTSKAGNKYRAPERWDHFQITRTTRDADGRLEIDEAIMELMPKDKDGKCRAIPVVVHSDVFDEIFPAALARYAGKQLLCRGDGEVANEWPNDGRKRTGDKPKERPCPCDALDAKKCKPNGALRCSIVAPGQAVAGAVHTWRTASIISIQQMLGSIAQIYETCGTVRGLPLTLRVSPVTVSPGGRTSIVHCCHLELRSENLLAAQQLALQLVQTRNAVLGNLESPQVMALLPAPAADAETPEEQAEIAAEFYHEPEPGDPGRHTIPDGPATKEPDQKLLKYIADVPGTATSDGIEKWLRRVVDGADHEDEIKAAADKLDEVMTSKAKAAAERDVAGEHDYGPPEYEPPREGDQDF